MKMRNNGLEADVFTTSRIPIQSPPSTKMDEGDLRYVARPPEPPAQAHHDHHAEDGAVAVAVAEPVAEPVAVPEACEQKGYKNSVFPSTVPNDHVWPTQTQTDHDAPSSIPRQTTAI